MLKIAIIDADLLDNGTNYPNLALMKISGYYKNLGHRVDLILSYNKCLDQYDKIYLSKVFTKTIVPEHIMKMEKLEYGGTGFYYDKAPNLPKDMEHSMPDYDLYRKYVDIEVVKGRKRKQLEYYTDYSIGFTSRGCVRKCKFCVNRNSSKSERHSPLSEFLSNDHKKITLLDDNVLACKEWREIFEELQSTGKKFKFQQGLDFRMLTREKMEVMKDLNYDGDFIFAFDNIEDKELIIRNLKLWNEIVGKQCRFYVFTGFENLEDGTDLEQLLERIKILMDCKHVPYIMRHENYNKSKYRGFYINISRWCNQPNFFKKKSFREFAEVNQANIKTKGKKCSCLEALELITNDFPDLEKYFDIKFGGKENG